MRIISGFFRAGIAGVAAVSVGCMVRADTRPAQPSAKVWPPVIGAWFWSQDVLAPDGYKPFLDAVAAHSPYTLLSTACRRVEITDPAMHDQAAAAVRYAADLGLKIALEVDIRLARQAFRARYPEELQQELVLKMTDSGVAGGAEVVFEGVDSSDHMIGALPKYECLTTRLVRVYAFVKKNGAIDPSSVCDITGDGVTAATDGPKRLTVRVPPRPGQTICVMAAHTLLTPDVFAPHLLPFQREIIRQYADLPLAGIMKDEWGFPPDHTGNPGHDRYWFSPAMAAAYEQASKGRDLVRDAMLMAWGEGGCEAERAAAINRYRKLCRERNVVVEDDFYRAGKETFGTNAFIVTHSTWIPYPGAQEFRKNGLSWWDATRDIGQSDESTPYPCRTSLAKRWGYPLWYNQFYAKDVAAYVGEVWAGALSGGRLNVHPLYPRPDLKGGERENALLRSGLMAALTRLRVLDFVTRAPLDCPVAVVFGHACAMNWTQPSYDDVGLGVASRLCTRGYPADLIPSSLVASKALTVDGDGYVRLGAQRYRAVVLYQPEFGDAGELDFVRRAAQGKSTLFQVGPWTRDLEAHPLETSSQLDHLVRVCTGEIMCADQVAAVLADQGVMRVTPWTEDGRRWGHGGGPLATPPKSGHAALTDGTGVWAAGSREPAGDPIVETLEWQGHRVTVDAVGIVAIRFAPDGHVAAFAAGGLKRVATDGWTLALPERADIAFVRESDGRVRGVVQGLAGDLPPELLALTTEWQRLSGPMPLP